MFETYQAEPLDLMKGSRFTRLLLENILEALPDIVRDDQDTRNQDQDDRRYKEDSGSEGYYHRNQELCLHAGF